MAHAIDANPAEKNSSFPFFDLPRELRNMFYDNLKEEKCCHLERDEYKPADLDADSNNKVKGFISATLYMLVPHARRVNHPFKTEVEAQYARYVPLKVIDRSHYRYPRALKDIAPAPVLATITHITCALILVQNERNTWDDECCYRGARLQIMGRTDWLRAHLSRAGSARELDIELYVEWPDRYDASWPKHPSDAHFGEAMRRLVTCTQLLSSATVLKLRDFSANFGGHHELWCRWTKDGGWQALDDDSIEEIAET